MKRSFIDFGKSVVNTQSHDAFILDTNVVLAYINKESPKHLAVFHFLNYLVSNDQDLYVTETVVHEAIHVLARYFYAQDKVQQQHPHSSDAMIAASTLNGDFNTVMGLITLDRDLTALSGIQVYFTEINNAQYDLRTMRQLLGFEDPFATKTVPIADC